MECQDSIFLLYDFGIGRGYPVRGRSARQIYCIKNRINMVCIIGIA